MEKLYHLAKAFERDELFFIGPELYLLDTENMRIDAFSPAQFNRFFEAVNIND